MFVRPATATFAHAAINVVLSNKGFMKLSQLLLFANKNDLFENRYSLFSFSFQFIVVLFYFFIFFFFFLLFFILLFFILLFFFFGLLPILTVSNGSFRFLWLGRLFFGLSTIRVRLRAESCDILLAWLVRNSLIGLTACVFSFRLHFKNIIDTK